MKVGQVYTTKESTENGFNLIRCACSL